MNTLRLTIGLAALLGWAPACYGKDPQAGFDAQLPPAPPPVAPARTDGAIFSVDAGYAPLYLGHRARAVGDPITIMLVESMETSKSAGSQTDRAGGFSLLPPTTGPLSFIDPNSVKASGGSNFKGKGTASQESSLSGQLSVTISEVRSNGTALVRGTKLLELSQGQEWVQFSGLVRLSDLDQDNRILSTRVADARVVTPARVRSSAPAAKAG